MAFFTQLPRITLSSMRCYYFTVRTARYYAVHSRSFVSTSTKLSTVGYNELYASIRSSKSTESVLNELQSYKRSLPPNKLLEVFKAVSFKALDLHAVKKLLHDTRYKSLCQRLTEEIKNLSMRDIVNLLWLIARIRLSDEELMNEIIVRLENNVSNLSAVDLGLVMWSLGTLRYSKGTEVLFDKVTKEMVLLLKGDLFIPHRSLANICWGFAVLEKWPSHFTPHIQAYLKHIDIRSFNNRYLTVIAWSLERADISCEPWLLDHISKIALKSLNSYILSLACWTFGRAKYYDETFCSELARILLTKNKKEWYDPRVLAEILWYLARIQYYNSDLMDHLASIALPDVKNMNAQKLTNIAYSYGFLNHCNHKLLTAVVDRTVLLAKSQLSENIVALLNVARFCLVSDVYPEQLIRLLCSQELLEIVKNDFRAFAQMMQFRIATSSEHPNVSLPHLWKQQKLLLPAIIGIKIEDNKETTFHNNVASTIKALFDVDSDAFISEACTTSSYIVDFEILLDSNHNIVYPPKERQNWTLRGIEELCQQESVDFSTLQTLYSSHSNGQYNLASDWYPLPSNVKRRICIEADGPFHFAANNNHILGMTALKHKQLKALGWEVIQIPYFEWNTLDFSILNHVNYLSEKIFNKRQTVII